MKLKVRMKMLSLHKSNPSYMDIQSEKLFLIEQLARVQDLNIIARIKAILKESGEATVGYKANGEAINQSELIARAEASNQSIKEGRTKSIEQLRKEVKNW
ncbi:hypothetical protein C900_01210 [Fulvivirga imtechensis AK7]|uniref:Uncharacterized protein n=1 Tax=Fulvivirga imtechensis AK7 TaxID=1237149 RepID=L8JGN6_9BACT|nr:hypothetical protein [Fulvivirga imtechensis]ELR68036.1 hypothetical protein C900_01210 [Fulvivirga imtechensis AK7]